MKAVQLYPRMKPLVQPFHNPGAQIRLSPARNHSRNDG
jgi:hypothetical protein